MTNNNICHKLHLSQMQQTNYPSFTITDSARKVIINLKNHPCHL